jgi:hypothetical protein
LKIEQQKLWSFAMAEMNTYILNDLDINKELALKELEKEILSEFEDLNSQQTKKARLEYFKIKGVKEDDYNERVLDLDEHRSIIYGIRHKGANKNVPFIRIRANFNITSLNQVKFIAEKIEHEFKVFKPLYINFHSKDKLDVTLHGCILMVSPVVNIKNLKPWKKENDISLIEVNDESYYDWYVRGYQEFHKASPELIFNVPVNSKRIMDDSKDQNLLFYIEYNGSRIGLIAAEKSSLLGRDGLYFNEIFISKDWKGKGLAKQVQRKFIDLYGNDHELVWGTIDSMNLPSYKTAYSNGRRPIRFECFHKLDKTVRV